MKHAFLDTLFDGLRLAAGLLALFTSFVIAPNLPFLAPYLHSQDGNTVILAWTLVIIGTFVLYTYIAMAIYKTVKRQVNSPGLASRRPLSRSWVPAVQSEPAASRTRKKAITIPDEQFQEEVAWVFSSLFPVRGKVEIRDGGKIHVKLYNDKDVLVGVVQASQDNERRALQPSVLRTLNSYKSKSGVPRAFLVTTACFSDELRQQAKVVRIDLVDGVLLDEWRKRARAKVGAG